MSNAGVPMYDGWYNEELKTEVVGYNKITEYRYHNSSLVNKYYKDTYSGWIDSTEAEASAQNCEKRYLYRYRNTSSTFVYRKLLGFTEWSSTPMNDNNWRNKEEKTMYRYRRI